MALQSQVVSVNFSGGVDTKTDEKLVVPGKLTLLENGVFTTGGKIKKRNGYQKLFSASSAQAVIGYGNELLALAGNQLLSYSPSQSGTVSRGSAYTVRVTNKSVIRNSYQQSTPDFDVASGFAVYAWADGRGGVRASVYDTTTDAAAQTDTLLSSTGTVPKVLAIGSYVFVFYVDSVGLKARRFNPATPSLFETEVSIATDIVLATPYYDVALSGSKAVIAYHIASNIKVIYVTDTGTVGSGAVGLADPITIAENPDNSIAVLVEQSSLNVWVIWHNSANGVRAAIRYPDFTSKLATRTVDAAAALAIHRITGGFTSSGHAQLFYEVNATNSYDHYIRTNTLTDSGTVGTSSVFKRSVGLASKAYTVDSELFVTAVFDSTLQATLFTLKSDGTIVSRMLSTLAGGLPTSRQLPQVVFVSSRQASFAAQVKTKFISNNGTQYTLKGITRVTVNYNAPVGHLARKLGECLHITGGFLQMYDGQSVVENGFHVFPEGYGVTASASTGGSMSNGTYLYYVCYEWTDNKGQVHRSSPGVGYSTTPGGGTSTQTVTLTIPTLRLTAKTGTRTKPTINVYRTTASGTVPYLVSSLSSPLYNDDTVDSVTFTDTLADSSITSNEILYTTGGIVDNIPAPACDLIETYKDRLIIRSTEDEMALWVSRGIAKGEGVAFNDSFITRVNPAGGAATALQFMDDKLLIFKTDRMFVMGGDGPNGAGQGSTLSVPELVTSDAGCTNPDSVVLMPNGSMFQSAKGIYLCTRALQVEYKGQEVEAYNALTIASASLIPNTNQVRFLTTAGPALMYDYLKDQWATFTNHAGLDADVWQSQYVYMRSNGDVWLETAGFYQDVNVGYSLRIGTAWLKLAGIQGYQRVRRASVLGDYYTAHGLRISVAYDYESAYGSVYLFAADTVLNQNYFGQGAYYGADTVYGGVTDNTYQFRLHLARQKCESIKFLFEDVSAGTQGQAYSLSDLSMEVAVKSGVNRQRLQKNVG